MCFVLFTYLYIAAYLLIIDDQLLLVFIVLSFLCIMCYFIEYQRFI